MRSLSVSHTTADASEFVNELQNESLVCSYLQEFAFSTKTLPATQEQPGQSVTLLPHEAVAHADGVAHANTVRVTEHSSVDSSLAMQQALASPYSIPPDPDFAITPDDISRGIHKGDVAASEYSKVAVVEATSQNFTALKSTFSVAPI